MYSDLKFMEIRPNGARLYSEFLSRETQESLISELRALLPSAPFFTPRMPRTGKPFSVRMTNFGPLGWVSDQTGYRYQGHHPVTQTPWPPIPESLLSIWNAVLPEGTPEPDACLFNYYENNAKMGLHRDEDEKDFSVPVVSISLGDDALFRLGGQSRKDKTQSFRLRSGDVLLLIGKDRTCFHGIDRIYPGTSSLLRDGGRINLTLRRAE